MVIVPRVGDHEFVRPLFNKKGLIRDLVLK